MRTLDRVARAFRVYQDLKCIMQNCEAARPQGIHGIAVADDYHAKVWRKHEFRVHVLESYIKGEPINWFYARWLSVDEADRRMSNKTPSQS